MVDLVQFLLETLSVHWDDANYDPQPMLWNQPDAQPYAETTIEDGTVDGSMVGLTPQGRSVDADLAKNNVISVGTSITRDDTPLDLYFNVRVDAAVGVRIEGVHGDEWGHIEDHADLLALRDEAKRAIYTERQWPLYDDGYWMLEISDGNDRSVAEKDYYRYDFTVAFSAYEDLP